MRYWCAFEMPAIKFCETERAAPFCGYISVALFIFLRSVHLCPLARTQKSQCKDETSFAVVVHKRILFMQCCFWIYGSTGSIFIDSNKIQFEWCKTRKIHSANWIIDYWSHSLYFWNRFMLLLLPLARRQTKTSRS